jgi:hypothetical protein
MSDIEGISDHTPRPKTRTYDRLLPSGGILIKSGLHPDDDLHYLDFNDTHRELIDSVRAIYQVDSEYQEMSGIVMGDAIGRKYRIYAMKAHKTIGAFSYTEILNSPLGYSSGDFFLEVYVLSEFRKSIYRKVASLTLFHLLFESDSVKRLYSVLRMKSDAVSVALDAIDFSANPCATEAGAYSEAGAYLSIGKIIDAKGKKFGFLEMDGETYKKMDKKKYLTDTGLDDRLVDAWLPEMAKFVDQVKECRK